MLKIWGRTFGGGGGVGYYGNPLHTLLPLGSSLVFSGVVVSVTGTPKDKVFCYILRRGIALRLFDTTLTRRRVYTGIEEI